MGRSVVTDIGIVTNVPINISVTVLAPDGLVTVADKPDGIVDVEMVDSVEHIGGCCEAVVDAGSVDEPDAKDVAELDAADRCIAFL